MEAYVFMAENNERSGFPSLGFPASQGFPAQQGFPTASGFPAMGGFPSTTVTSNDENNKAETEAAKVVVDEPKAGTPPKNVRYFEGTTKLNKTETKHAWNEFGGERLATYEKDGSSFITRIIERESKKSGVYFKLEERLTRDADGYGVIAWRIDLGSIVRRRPPKQKFQEAWRDSILAKVREVVADGVGVAAASRSLAEELGVSFSTMRANLWVADKWSRGETTTFLPHRSMIRSIFELMCELGKEKETLQSLVAYSKAVKKPSEYVAEILREYDLM